MFELSIHYKPQRIEIVNYQIASKGSMSINSINEIDNIANFENDEMERTP